jgi:hypothetical protein
LDCAPVRKKALAAIRNANAMSAVAKCFLMLSTFLPGVPSK